jgi:hypothetical protein
LGAFTVFGPLFEMKAALSSPTGMVISTALKPEVAGVAARVGVNPPKRLIIAMYLSMLFVWLSSIKLGLKYDVFPRV